jgi:hypothetical protein
MRVWLAVFAALAAVIFAVWVSDRVTLQGERTVYTVECRDGAWQGARCSGRLVAAERFRFRALKPHREVVFWTVRGQAPSGKFTDCNIKDGRNWTCTANAEASSTITLQMSGGLPVHDTTGRTRAFHSVTKWQWFLLSWGIPIGSAADD